MSKQERLSIIRRLALLRFGASLGSIGLIPATLPEIRQETKQVHSRTFSDDEIRDEEIIGVESHLPFDSIKIHVKESDYVLSASERKQLDRDVALSKMT